MTARLHAKLDDAHIKFTADPANAPARNAANVINGGVLRSKAEYFAICQESGCPEEGKAKTLGNTPPSRDQRFFCDKCQGEMLVAEVTRVLDG
jgi:hypothetical protein